MPDHQPGCGERERELGCGDGGKPLRMRGIVACPDSGVCREDEAYGSSGWRISAPRVSGGRAARASAAQRRTSSVSTRLALGRWRSMMESERRRGTPPSCCGMERLPVRRVGGGASEADISAGSDRIAEPVMDSSAAGVICWKRRDGCVSARGLHIGDRSFDPGANAQSEMAERRHESGHGPGVAAQTQGHMPNVSSAGVGAAGVQLGGALSGQQPLSLGDHAPLHSDPDLSRRGLGSKALRCRCLAATAAAKQSQGCRGSGGGGVRRAAHRPASGRAAAARLPWRAPVCAASTAY